jgi:hypothetical protein
MAQPINIPVHFQFLRTPCVWEIRTVMRRWAVGEPRVPVRMLFPTTDIREDYRGKPQLLDGWNCRDEFFKLPQNEESLLGFLSKVGVWYPGSVTSGHWSKEVMRHCLEGHPLPLPVDGVWGWRKSLGESLVNRKKFIENHAPALQQAQTLAEALHRGSRSNKFSLSLEMEKSPEGVVTVTNAHHMLLTTVYVDIVRGLGFKYCRRSDCKAPFAVTNNHEKFYCSQPCAHLENVRKKRREAREVKRSIQPATNGR